MREVVVNVTCDLCKQATGDLVEEHKVTLTEDDRIIQGTADLCPSCWHGVIDYLRQSFALEAKRPKVDRKPKVQCDICGRMFASMGLPTHKSRKHGIMAESGKLRLQKAGLLNGEALHGME